MKTLIVFSAEEANRAKRILAGKVASMMGRKMEEGDWSDVYCKAKSIPSSGWSNLHIDIDHEGLGVEFKMLRIAQLRGKPITSVCGTTLMHPAATRSIRINDVTVNADLVMRDVLRQYGDLIEERTARVKDNSSDGSADMRVGWLLWEDTLTDFLYFEEAMVAPEPDLYYSIWNETPARGARKASRNLWIYEKRTDKKRFSVTTSAGIKIQPYFDVPAPTDQNLVYFRVQSERVDEDTIVLWVGAATARQLEEKIGSADKNVVSEAICEAVRNNPTDIEEAVTETGEAVGIRISNAAFELLTGRWQAVNDDHRVQLFLRSLG